MKFISFPSNIFIACYVRDLSGYKQQYHHMPQDTQ
jgi:hypothetical protein